MNRILALLDPSRPLDGAMGTELIARHGACLGHPLPVANSEQPDRVAAVHRAYTAAGAQLATTNTLLAPILDQGVALVATGVAVARDGAPGLPIALSLGPGATDSAVYGTLAAAGATAGATLVQLETFVRAEEAARAVRAIRATAPPELSLIVLLVFTAAGNVLGCNTPASAAARLLLDAGADTVGANCAPPDGLDAAIAGLDTALPPGVPLVLRPSAGIPQVFDESVTYPWAPVPWAAAIRAVAARVPGRPVLLGGCCGAGPAYIAALQSGVGC